MRFKASHAEFIHQILYGIKFKAMKINSLSFAIVRWEQSNRRFFRFSLDLVAHDFGNLNVSTGLS